MVSNLIRILIVDDHALVREALSALIGNQSDMQVAAEAENGAEAVAAFRHYHPDITLMDVRMPQMDGLEATARIRKEFPDACVIILSTFNTEEEIRGARQAGACAFLLKDTARAKLFETIRTLRNNPAHCGSFDAEE